MTTSEYANKLVAKNKEYPWIDDNGKFTVPQGSDELIKMRKEYFFNK